MIKEEDKELVLSSVTMRDIAGMYGYKVTSSGFMSCPFHGKDEHPSMKVYDGDRGFNCFVCHRGGDIIKFVRDHDGLDFEPAVRLIANHFGIPIADGNAELTDADRERIAKRRDALKAAEDARNARSERLKELASEIHWLKGKQAGFEPLGAVWCSLQRKIEEYTNEWEMLYGEEVKG